MNFVIEDRIRRAARKLVYLEQEAQRAAAIGDESRADVLWQQRENIREGRSLMLRQLWARRRSSQPVVRL